MHIKNILQQRSTVFSFEFFPPKTPKASERLFQSISQLQELKPGYISVTYGAGGSTRELTHDLIVRLKKQTDFTIVSHLTCVGSTRDQILQILQTYDAAGIQNIMALRGDPPANQKHYTPTQGGFTYAADLVSFIKKHFPHMGIGVAGFPEGHPRTPNRLLEIEYLKQKVDAGADYICTQLFFDNRDFYDFCQRCELAGITVPILAGIMPVTSQAGFKRMAELAAGARFPAKLIRLLNRAEGEVGFEQAGIHWATQQVADLVDNNVRGIHFYTLNKSHATVKIYQSLGLSPLT